MVTRSRASARQHVLPRIASAPTSSPWPRLPAELLGRIASACESCAALRAMDALDRSLWSTRVERLLGALRCTPTEPLLLHVRHVALTDNNLQRGQRGWSRQSCGDTLCIVTTAA